MIKDVARRSTRTAELAKLLELLEGDESGSTACEAVLLSYATRPDLPEELAPALDALLHSMHCGLDQLLENRKRRPARWRIRKYYEVCGASYWDVFALEAEAASALIRWSVGSGNCSEAVEALGRATAAATEQQTQAREAAGL